MDLIQAAVLAFVQGFTEFLPISSSGHLVLVPKLFGWEDQGLAFDVAVHVGSLLAVVIYFWHDVCAIISAVRHNLLGGAATVESRLGWSVLFATIPVGLVGLLLNNWIELNLRSVATVGIASLLFGIVLWIIDKRGSQGRSLPDLNLKDVLIIGCAQAIALVPGVSRSGMTIMAGRLMGLERPSAARFSFLMSIPVIVLAGGLKTFELSQSDVTVNWDVLIFALVFSGLVAYACIHWFLRFIARYTMAPFAIYLMILGVLLIGFFR